MIDTYLKEHIDNNAMVADWDPKPYLPLSVIANYNFASLSLLGKQCLLVQPNDQSGRVETLVKLSILIMNKVKFPVIFHFTVLSSYKRKLLIDARVPFLVDNGQMYLPFIALEIVPTNQQKPKSNLEAFSPITQLTYLYFLYHETLEADISKIAEDLDISSISASRALTELGDRALLEWRVTGITGRQKIYRRPLGGDYYAKGREWLKSPVAKIVYLPRNRQTMNYLRSGLDALAELSMLNPPSRPVRAISKKEYSKIEPLVITARDEIAELDVVEMQIWQYNPALLSLGPCVDIASMIQSISEYDERIELAIDSILRGTTWFTA